MMGRPVWTMGFEPGLFVAAPATCPVALESTNPSMSFCPPRLPSTNERRSGDEVDRVGRPPRLLRGRDREGRRVRSAGRIETTPPRSSCSPRASAPDDRVALEVTGNALGIKRIIEPHVAGYRRQPADTGIRQARAKTDRLDARTLCEAAGRGLADARLDARRADPLMRRRLQRRSQLVRARTRAKNELHAVLMRAAGRPAAGQRPVRQAGRHGLPSSSCRSTSARRSMAAAPGRVPRPRDRGGRAADRTDALGSARDPPADDRARGERDLRGDVPGRGRRHRPLREPAQARRLPRPRSAGAPVGLGARRRHGRISKQGSGPSATRSSKRPGRGSPAGPAARLLRSASAHAAAPRSRSWPQRASSPACSGACSPARRTTPRPAVADREEAAPARAQGRRLAVRAYYRARALDTPTRMREAERELAEQGEPAYRRRRATGKPRPRRRARARHRGAHLVPSSDQAARQATAPDPAL